MARIVIIAWTMLVLVAACAPRAPKVIKPGFIHASPFLTTTYDVEDDTLIITIENEKPNATPNVSVVAVFLQNGAESGRERASTFAIARYDVRTMRLPIPDGAEKARISTRLSQPRIGFVGKEGPPPGTGAAGTIDTQEFIMLLK